MSAIQPNTNLKRGILQCASLLHVDNHVQPAEVPATALPGSEQEKLLPLLNIGISISHVCFHLISAKE